MRYKEKVEFCVEQKKYDPKQGKEVTTVIESKLIRANVTDASQEIMQVAFGDWRKGTKVIRLLKPLPFVPTHAVYEDKKYKVATKREPSRKSAFIVEELTK
ncbi:hypothetical protein GIX45_28335 [Erwinia sp. CPCC 100877]|nr:hypothetical protein [Erwinia sp. CPCC 100877]